MFIPFLSSRTNRHVRRKGGGGGGKGGGGGGGSKGGGGTTGGKGGTSGTTSHVSAPNIAGGKSGATTYGAGGGKAITIPSGQAFAGRQAGGGTRNQVYGTNTYGSGYPTGPSRGVGGLGLPFYFWPVVWGGSAVGAGAYLHESREYGNPDNSTRPGGPMTQARFQSNSTGTTFHLLADNSTITALISAIRTNCTNFDLNTSNSSTAAATYNATSLTDPQPEQAIQYYRASSIVLTLDGYNNTAALSNDTNAPPSPLPSGIDTTLLGCMNDTTGQAAPLVDAALRWGPPNVGSLVLLWITFCLSRVVI